MRKLTRDDFISKAKEIHGEKYNYSKVEYINNSTKVDIICNGCGSVISLTPSHHFRGQGCRQCSMKRFSDKMRFTTEDFISRSNEIHGDKYDYSKVEYINKETKVTIICPVHGEFEQKPANHWRYGCNQCGYDKSGMKQKHSYDDIINRAKEIHGERYSYIIKENPKYKDKVTVVCPVHGEFEQKIGNHIYKGYGCPKCAAHISRQEIELQEWVSQYVDIITNTRSVIPPLELDIVIPSHNIAIEYNGIYWHSEQRGKDKKYHLNKYLRCKESGYRLIQIWENEWLNQKDIVKSIILSALSMYQKKVYGRKCEIMDVDSKVARDFYNDNHIQGFQSGVHHGLYYENELVSLMTVKYYNSSPILERFVNKRNTLVHGGFSKLLKSFDSIDGMVTFSDPRYFTGNVYESNGFEYSGMVKPNYWYFKINTIDICHRRRFQRKKIEKDNSLIFDDTLTEYENMLLNGFDRIWDCGNMRYVYNP
jgi:very-short-patch-repair endonuclease